MEIYANGREWPTTLSIKKLMQYMYDKNESVDVYGPISICHEQSWTLP